MRDFARLRLALLRCGASRSAKGISCSSPKISHSLIARERRCCASVMADITFLPYTRYGIFLAHAPKDATGACALPCHQGEAPRWTPPIRGAATPYLGQGLCPCAHSGRALHRHCGLPHAAFESDVHQHHYHDARARGSDGGFPKGWPPLDPRSLVFGRRTQYCRTDLTAQCGNTECDRPIDERQGRLRGSLDPSGKGIQSPCIPCSAR